MHRRRYRRSGRLSCGWARSTPVRVRVATAHPVGRYRRPDPDQALGQGSNLLLAERVFDQFRLMWRGACNPTARGRP